MSPLHRNKSFIMLLVMGHFIMTPASLRAFQIGLNNDQTNEKQHIVLLHTVLDNQSPAASCGLIGQEQEACVKPINITTYGNTM